MSRVMKEGRKAYVWAWLDLKFCEYFVDYKYSFKRDLLAFFFFFWAAVQILTPFCIALFHTLPSGRFKVRHVTTQVMSGCPFLKPAWRCSLSRCVRPAWAPGPPCTRRTRRASCHFRTLKVSQSVAWKQLLCLNPHDFALSICVPNSKTGIPCLKSLTEPILKDTIAIQRIRLILTCPGGTAPKRAPVAMLET